MVVSRRTALIGLTAAMASVSFESISLSSFAGGHGRHLGRSQVRRNPNGALPPELARDDGSDLRVRKNARSLSPDEKRTFVDAIKALKQIPSPWSNDVNTYDEFVRWHRDAFDGDPMPGHMGSAFFPWHRMLSLLLEQELRKVNPGLTIPYWDWTVDGTRTAYLWKPDFLGGDGDPADSFIVKTGPFRQGEWALTIFDDEDGAKIPHLLRAFARDRDATTLPTAADDAEALSISIYDAAPWDETSIPDHSFRRYMETGRSCPKLPPGRRLARHSRICPDAPGMHNRVHVWIAGAFGHDPEEPEHPQVGTMGRATAPNDPVFWLMHANIDRLWAEWQRRYGQLYLPIEGGPPGHNLNDTMWPFRNLGLDVTPKMLLDHHALGYAYDSELPAA